MRRISTSLSAQLVAALAVACSSSTPAHPPPERESPPQVSSTPEETSTTGSTSAEEPRALGRSRVQEVWSGFRGPWHVEGSLLALQQGEGEDVFEATCDGEVLTREAEDWRHRPAPAPSASIDRAVRTDSWLSITYAP